MINHKINKFQKKENLNENKSENNFINHKIYDVNRI